MWGTKPSSSWTASTLASSATARSPSPSSAQMRRGSRSPTATARGRPTRGGPCSPPAASGPPSSWPRRPADRPAGTRHGPIMPTCAIVSFRLGGTDGVSIVAEAWSGSLAELGFTVRTVAGEGPVDRLVPGPGHRRGDAPDERPRWPRRSPTSTSSWSRTSARSPSTSPPPGSSAAVLAGRPAILHHHDPPWQRARFAHITELPPDDPAWRHVCINQRTRAELAERGIDAVTIYNGFDPDPPPGDREGTRVGARRRPRRAPPGPPRAGHRAQERAGRAGPGRSRRAAPTGCPAGPRRATGPTLEGLLAAARLPGDPPGLDRPFRPLRRRRRRPVPLDLGGVRQPAGRGRAPRPAGRRRRVPGGRRAAGASASGGFRPTTRPRSPPGWPPPTPPSWPTTGRWPRPTCPSPPRPKRSGRCSIGQAGCRDRPRPRASGPASPSWSASASRPATACSPSPWSCS